MKAIYTIFILLIFVSCSKEEEEPVTISGHGITFNSATLHWFNALPNAEHFSIQIYLEDNLVAELEDVWSYKLTNLDENTTYSGQIISTNLTDNSTTTALFSFKTLMNKPPEDFIISLGNKITGNSITVSWSRPFDPDGDTIEFDLILSDMPLAENLTVTNYTINDLSPETDYTLVVLARDNHGHEIKNLVRFTSLAQGAELSHNKGEFGGLDRAYGIYVPPATRSEKLPVVIRLHGWGLTIWPFMIKDYLVTLAQKENFIHIQPQGNAMGVPRWDAGNNNDVNFINELIDTIITKHNADPERIYLTGFSNGGGMTIHLAKEMEDRLAAIAPIAASIYTTTSYTLKKPMPLCYVHGTADSDAYQKYGTPIDYDRRLKFWIENNNVNPEPIITEMADINPNDNSTVTKFVYINPNSSGDIVFYRVNNGGHTIPGVYWPANHDMNAYDEIWNFFKTRKLSDK